MYWIIFSVITLITIFFILGFIVLMKDDGGDAGSMFLASAFCGLVMWAFIENKTYEYGKPTNLPSKSVSIMKDNEVAIIRYKDFQETYKSKKEYDAIVDSSFVLEETVEYNIQGEENGRIYKLVIK